MLHYQINIYWSQEDNAYLAEVPELPGCMADGETYQAALENVQLIMQEWIDIAKELNREIPVPQSKLVGV
jgi:predicted RNase H-like HicB family nuclease